MTGFDETVPSDPDVDADETAVDGGETRADGVTPQGGPEFIDADDEKPPAAATT